MRRNNSIDFLRFLGLSLIFLAHSSAPTIISQIRSFDVPLMIFISGLTSSGKDISDYFPYVWKRTKRLIIPVWSFLLLYLSSFYFLQLFVLPEQYLTFEMIWRSFLLLDNSIGYVWIIRVFLLIMLLTPILQKIVKRINNVYILLTLIFFLLTILQISVYITRSCSSCFINTLIKDYFIYIIAYSTPFIAGLRLRHDAGKEGKIVLFFFIILFLIGELSNIIQRKYILDISLSYKYPPQPHFIIYGTLISVLLWLFKNSWKKLANNRFTNYVGRNSIWLYLWHMPFALCSTVLISGWFTRFIFIYLGSAICFYIQYCIVKKINKPFLSKYFLG